MGAIAATKVVCTEFAGNEKTKVFTVTPGSASDTIDLSTFFSSITAVLTPQITAGADANLLTGHATVSGTTVTLVTKGADGLAASDWTTASVQLVVIGQDVNI